jgi:AcrR family transcriptional regulator
MLYAVKAMPRPRSLTSEDIAKAALAVIDRDGLAALTMRAVATELGMGTMSLYRYVSDRAQLEALVVDLVLAEVDFGPPRRASWQRQVAVLAERVRAAVGAHPEVVSLTMIHRQSSMNSLRWGEAVLGVLAGAGFTGQARVIALRSVLGYVIGSIQLDYLGPLNGTGTEIIATREDFPLLAETARRARKISADEEFRRGLDALLRGLSAAEPNHVKHG